MYSMMALLLELSLHTAAKLGTYFWNIDIVGKLEVCHF
jgi:hypothetical protein